MSYLLNRVLICAVVALSCAALFGGCGAGGSTVPAKGKVVYNGQPVTGGELNFSPTGGAARPAVAMVSADGSFTVYTDTTAGIAPGKHAVNYNPPNLAQPEWDGHGQRPKPNLSGFENLKPKEKEVEAKTGGNDWTIELAGP